MQSSKSTTRVKAQDADNSKHVLNKQGVELADFARKAGVNRKQWADYFKNKEKREALFSEMKNGTTDKKWFEKLQAEAEKIGGRVHLIERLVVDYRKPHNDAAMAGGPQTESTYNVLKVASLYQPEKKKVTETIVLFNWPKGGGSYEKAVQFGLKNGLRQTTPHVPFAIGEKFTKLNYELGPNPMFVAETTGCTFGGHLDACSVYWFDARRLSDLDWQSNFGYSSDWFAFRK